MKFKHRSFFDLSVVTRYRILFGVSGAILTGTLVGFLVHPTYPEITQITRIVSIFACLLFAGFAPRYDAISRSPHRAAVLVNLCIMSHMAMMIWVTSLSPQVTFAAIITGVVVNAWIDSRIWLLRSLTICFGLIALTGWLVPEPKLSITIYSAVLAVAALLSYTVISGLLAARETLALKELELKLSQRFAKVGGWEVRASDNARRWTPTTLEILEVPDGFDPSGELPEFILDDPANDALNRSAERLFERGEPYDVVCKLQTFKGRIFWARAQAQAIFEGGKPVRFIGVFSDITEQIERERVLTEARDVAENAALARTQFLANMSHEIRTPMNGVIGMASLLAQSELREEDRKLVDVIRGSGEALLSIINDILDFTKIDAGKVELEEVDFDLHDLVRDAASVIEPAASEKDLTLEVDQPESTTATRLVGDPGRIRQIMLNLLSNAVKFTDRGTVGFKVNTCESSAGRCCLCIEVSDTGIGIDDSKQATLFDPFVQADASTTRNYGGTGLGLAICKELVEAMGGTITLDSTAGRGSTFRIRMNLPKATDARLAMSEHPPAEAPLDAGLRILIAEDNAVNQQVATRMLERLGYQPAVADDGQEAVDAIRAEEFDLILMDLQMPIMDGFEATRAIRSVAAERGRQPQIVALTANALQQDQQAAIAAGMDSFITKPVRLKDLRQLLAGVSRAS